MYSKIFFNLILIITLFILQFAFVSGLPFWFGSMNLIIVVLIFILGIGNVGIAVWWMFALAVLMEIFSFMPFGIILISLALAFTLATVLLMNYFADRTLYSFLAITVITTSVYEVLLYLLNYLSAFILRNDVSFILNSGFFIQKLGGLLMNLLVVFIFYYIINYLSKNLKPVFLIRKK